MLGGTIKYHLSQNKNELTEKIIENLYVDNILVDSLNRSDVVSLAENLKQLFKTGGFNLREFNSNARQAILQLPESEREAKETVKILGLKWNTVEDSLSINFPKSDSNKSPTKRIILSLLSSPFDPLGLSFPILIELHY